MLLFCLFIRHYRKSCKCLGQNQGNNQRCMGKDKRNDNGKKWVGIFTIWTLILFYVLLFINSFFFLSRSWRAKRNWTGRKWSRRKGNEDWAWTKWKGISVCRLIFLDAICFPLTSHTIIISCFFFFSSWDTVTIKGLQNAVIMYRRIPLPIFCQFFFHRNFG